eukprot:5013663-Prymnesium_polylepis.1
MYQPNDFRSTRGAASSNGRSGAPAPFCNARRRTNELLQLAGVLLDAQHGHLGHSFPPAMQIPGLGAARAALTRGVKVHTGPGQPVRGGVDGRSNRPP